MMLLRRVMRASMSMVGLSVSQVQMTGLKQVQELRKICSLLDIVIYWWHWLHFLTLIVFQHFAEVNTFIVSTFQENISESDKEELIFGRTIHNAFGNKTWNIYGIFIFSRPDITIIAVIGLAIVSPHNNWLSQSHHLVLRAWYESEQELFWSKSSNISSMASSLFSKSINFPRF